jgi:hypothetical protein
MACQERNALPSMSHPRRPDKHFRLGCTTSPGLPAASGHDTRICPSATGKMTCHHGGAPTKHPRAQDHQRPTLHQLTGCRPDTLFLPLVSSKLLTYLWKNHDFEIKYLPLSVALSYPWFLVTSDPSNGLGLGLTQGLVRVHADSGMLLAYDLFLHLGPKARGHGKQTLSKTRRTTKNPRLGGYGVFALQRDQNPFSRTSNLVTLVSGQIASHCPTSAMAKGQALSRKAVMSI